jgi:aryl-alcohol dehydrogenase-like predicted oxidoreductase
MDAIALAAVLAQPWADVVLSGATTAAQLLSNVAATNVVWNNKWQAQFDLLAESPEDYWKKRSALKWN